MRTYSTVGRLLWRLTVAFAGVVAVAIVVVVALWVWVSAGTSQLIYSSTDPQIPHNHAAIVFGAGLTRAGGPSPMLYDRVAVAAALYKDRKIDKILMTGDNSTVDHNEVEVMRQTAAGMGVADGDIILDHAGFNTWDSCFRAAQVFGLKEATLVTQRFHLPRALFTCNHLGVKSIGVSADLQPYDTAGNTLREFPALVVMELRIVLNDQPRFLGPRVDIDEPQPR